MVEWISVKDKLPAETQECIFVIDTPAYYDAAIEEAKGREVKTVLGDVVVYKAQYNGHSRLWSYRENGYNYGIYDEHAESGWGEENFITHWMPLPPPPET